MIVRTRYSTPLIDAIISDNGIEAVVESVKHYGNPRWYEHTRGYIMSNPYADECRWVVFMFGYGDIPAEAKQFETLGAAREWAKSLLKSRRSVQATVTK